MVSSRQIYCSLLFFSPFCLLLNTTGSIPSHVLVCRGPPVEGGSGAEEVVNLALSLHVPAHYLAIIFEVFKHFEDELPCNVQFVSFLEGWGRTLFLA